MWVLITEASEQLTVSGSFTPDLYLPHLSNICHPKSASHNLIKTKPPFFFSNLSAPQLQRSWTTCEQSVNGIWTDLLFFFFCSLAETLENFSGHVLLILLSLPPPSLFLILSTIFSTHILMQNKAVLWFSAYPDHIAGVQYLLLSFWLFACISTAFLLSRSPVSFSSRAVYHCCLAALCINPGLAKQPCLLSPLGSASLRKVLLSWSAGIRSRIHVCVYGVLTNSFLLALSLALQIWQASIIFNPFFPVQAEAVWWRSYGAWSWNYGLCGGWCTIMEAAG